MAKLTAKKDIASSKKSGATAKKTAMKSKEPVKYKLPDSLKEKLKANLKNKTKVAEEVAILETPETTIVETEETMPVMSEKARARELAKAKLIETVRAKYAEKAKAKQKETTKSKEVTQPKPIEKEETGYMPAKEIKQAEAKKITTTETLEKTTTPVAKTKPTDALKAKVSKEKQVKTVTEQYIKPIEEILPDVSLEAVAKDVAADELLENTIEKKLMALYHLQQIDTKIDKIRIIRGELPLEVEDLEDEIAGLETRIDNYVLEIEQLQKQIKEKEAAIKDSQSLIKKYEDQQMNVRNNREYDSLTKEIEFQTLEIQLAEKKIREFSLHFISKNEEIVSAQKNLDERRNDLSIKKSELDDITTETRKEEENLVIKSEENQKLIETRLLTAYKRIRQNMRNGLAVVSVERDACGGCFNKIPPQRQLDIRMHRKIIVCEYCGRILVDSQIVDYFK